MAIKVLKFKTEEELVEKMPGTFKNCPANDDNIQQMKYWFDTLVEVCKIVKPNKQIIIKAEYKIPEILHLMYSYFGSNEKILTCIDEKSIGGYRFLKIDELKQEKNVLIYDSYSGEVLYETDILIYCVTLKSKNLYAIDLQKEWHLDYVKNKWYWAKDHIPLYKNLIILLTNIFISNKNHIFKTNIKNIGSFFKLEKIDKMFEGYLNRFKDFDHYWHTIYYNIQYNALGWFRSGNIHPDLLFGCDDKNFTEEIIKKFNFDKAKIYK
jgi:hypothetical protein